MNASESAAADVRSIATEILLKVDTREAFADILLEHAYSSSTLDERDRALLTELVYGTLRWRGKIDAQLKLRLSRPLADTDPFVRNLLRLAVYQILYLDKIPEYAAVNEAVRAAKTHGGKRVAGFVNGVLRNVLRERDRTPERDTSTGSVAALSVEYSHPDWLVRRWIEELGREEAIALMAANNEKPPLVARVNLRKTTREKLLKLFCDNGIMAQASRWSPQAVTLDGGPAVSRLPGFAEGLFQIQGEASQLIAYLLSPQPEERILDACAAPGGKATHIAELMNDTGAVVAADRSARGVAKIQENAARLGLTSITAKCADMTQDFRACYPNPFDRILVDAPCSGLGTLRAHPEIKWRRNECDIERLSRLQSELLARAADSLRPGGILVYSTCTLARPENSAVIESLMHRRPEFELQNAADYLPEQARPLAQDGYLRPLPHRHNTDGFFAARIRKVA